MRKPMLQGLFGAAAEAVPLADALGARSTGTEVRSLLDMDPRTLQRDEELRDLESQLQRATAETQTARTELSKLVAGYKDGIERLSAAGRALRRAVAADTVDLALLVARELIGREPEACRDTMVGAIEKALQGHEDVRASLRLGRDDLSHIRAHSPELVHAGIELIEDRELEPGAFVLELPDRVLDGTFDARLARIRELLLPVLTQEEPDAQ